jgi:hypothetical protein
MTEEIERMMTELTALCNKGTKGQFEGRTRTWSNFGFWYRGLKQEA